MIERKDLVKIGKFKKPHKIWGEITIVFINNSFDEIESPFLICELDGIYVPFKLLNCHFISDISAYILLKNINSDEKTKILINKEVYIEKKYFTEEAENNILPWDYFIGFTLYDKQTGKIGTVSDVDDSTSNVLFMVETGHGELLIPAAAEWIKNINKKKKELFLDLPEGLII
jgi:16S rRNA processing protein RimM